MINFIEANFDNRFRRPVRGRVIVATTSAHVEYLTEDLRQTIPLYAPYINPGLVFVFTVEMEEGFLTFDGDAYVKIVEIAPFKQFFYDPSAGSTMTPADPFQPLVQGGGPYDATKGFINVQTDPNNAERYYFEVGPGRSYDYVMQFIADHFPVGSVFKGPDKYPGVQLTK